LPHKNRTARSDSASHFTEHLGRVASKFRLRVRRDECGDPVIPGRTGQLYVHDDSLLGVLVFLPSKRAWSHARKRLLVAGFTLFQDCDIEGTAGFDPRNRAQVDLAIKVAGVKRRRRISRETAARLASFSKSRRSIAGTALLVAGTSAGGDGCIPPRPRYPDPESGSPATRHVEMGGE
jgi:hypothetical protein